MPLLLERYAVMFVAYMIIDVDILCAGPVIKIISRSALKLFCVLDNGNALSCCFPNYVFLSAEKTTMEENKFGQKSEHFEIPQGGDSTRLRLAVCLEMQHC